MLWQRELPWYQAAVLWLLRLGTVPHHVAIMPDGSRRFSRRTRTDLHSTYVMGTSLYEQVCRWCLSTGVHCVTGFFLAARQMERSASERQALLSGVIDTWMEGIENLEGPRKLGLELRTVGRINLLPVEFTRKLAALEVATSHVMRRSKAITFSIDGTKSQMVQLVLDMAKAFQAGIIHREDITEELIEDCASLAECPPVNLLLRCAGPRFSDFVVPQCSYAYLHMEPKSWEAIAFFDWIWMVLMYQLHWPSIAAVKDTHIKAVKSKNSTQSFLRQRTFMLLLESRRMAYIAELSDGFICPSSLYVH